MHDGDARPAPVASRIKRRDRHGRGLRGLLAPPGVPLRRSRAQQFGDLVVEAVAQLEPRWDVELSRVEFAVQEVPDGDLPDGERDAVPLARLDPGPDKLRDPGPDEPRHPSPDEPRDPAHGPRIILYRRALLARADSEEELADLVLDVVIEEFSRLLGVDPETVDPGYDEND